MPWPTKGASGGGLLGQVAGQLSGPVHAHLIAHSERPYNDRKEGVTPGIIHTRTGQFMTRKVILDVDPGVDDAVALALALWDPRLEVLAVTATGGNVSPEQATRNVQTVIEQLDPPRWPRIGAANPDQTLRRDGRSVHGENGLGGAQFRLAELHHRHRSDKVLSDTLRSVPSGEVTILALGPLSNIATMLRAEPDLAGIIGHLVIMGGAVTVPGNVTAAAEHNIYADAHAARTVFASPVTKTLVPLDVTSQVVMTYDLLDRLPPKSTRTGAFLRSILPGSFRLHHQLGLEGIYLHDVVALLAALHPGLFRTEGMHGDVETEGTLTYGMTVFDRRIQAKAQPNMDVAIDADCAGVIDCILRGIDQTG